MPGITRRRGNSLIELLVTMALISILVGLMIPAVQRARAAADRSACQNNLRQIGLALHMYHDGKGGFPPGMSFRADQSRYPFMGWGPRLTPYLEQGALWNNIHQAFSSDPNPSDFYGFAAHRRILGTPQWMFACPSDSRTPGPALVGIHLIAFTSYLGVAGTNQSSRDGLLFVDSSIRLTHIHDGSSNTLLVGERPPAADLVFGWWYRGWGQQQNGSAEMVLGMRERNTTGSRYSCSVGPYEFVAGQFDNQCDMFHFWSPHPGGANFLFADGSLRFLSYSANSIMPALATRGGGEVVTIHEEYQ